MTLNNIKTFLINNWYPVSMGIIAIIVIILLLIGTRIKVLNLPPSDNTNCKPNNNNYITGVNISGLANGRCDNDVCCSGGSSYFEMNDGNNSYMNSDIDTQDKNNYQVCYTLPDNNKYCDDTQLVTDIKVIDMSDPTQKNGWKPLNQRCCESTDQNCQYSPVISLFPDSFTSDRDGQLLEPDVAGCSKMGLCVQTLSAKEIRSKNIPVLTGSNVKFIYGEIGGGIPVCDTTWVTDPNNIRKNCTNLKPIYLCKKYINLI